MAFGRVPLSGIISVRKPPGITSFDVVSRINRAIRARYRGVKVGHGGTLDRDAEGVLVIGIGDGCSKLHDHLHGDKQYTARARLGTATDTLDASGIVIRTAPYEHVTLEQITQVLAAKFTGNIEQAAPIYSALKVGQERMSDLARRGIHVEQRVRTVTIHSISCTAFAPPEFSLDVKCGGGTYIRSIIDDLGKSLNSAAHMTHLLRSRQGNFSLENALVEEHWTIAEIERLLEQHAFFEHSKP